jgi:hypothetical protein
MSRVHRPVARWRLISLVGIGSVVVLIGPLFGWHPGSAVLVGVLYLLPAIVMGVVLLAGRYPGVRALERLRQTRASPTGRPVSSRAPRQPGAQTLRGGRLIAVSLAGRAPPRAAVCC